MTVSHGMYGPVRNALSPLVIYSIGGSWVASASVNGSDAIVARH